MDKRANMLQGEYRRKARDADRIYGGHIGENVGPVERKLLQFGDVIGLVVGAFGEGSEDLHDLVQQMAESRATSMGLKRGREATDAEIGMAVGQIRRAINTTVVRAQAGAAVYRGPKGPCPPFFSQNFILL